MLPNDALALDLEGDILPSLGIEIVEVVGDEIICHCPDLMGFHANGDSTPSFAVNREKLVHNCYVCGGGTLPGLVGAILGLEEDKAIDWLIEHASWAPTAAEDFPEEVERILQVYDDEEEVLPSYSEETVFKYRSFHPYLEERGITPEVAEEMNVGYDPEHQAIVLPVWFRGRLVGIQRRHLVQADGKYVCARCQKTDKKIPKYKNTANFPRNTVWYNFDSQTENEPRQVIVVESPFTVLRLKSLGVHNVVASFGAGLSRDKVKPLWAFYEGVFFWGDNDPAGLKSIKDGILILEEQIPVFVIPLIPGEKADPADVSPEELPTYLAAAYSSVLIHMEGFKVGIPEIYS